METTEKVDGQCKGGHGDKEISFPMTYDQHTKQHRVETSGRSLIIISKMMEERKEGLDKSISHAACMVYGLAYRSDSELFCICGRLLPLFAIIL